VPPASRGAGGAPAPMGSSRQEEVRRTMVQKCDRRVAILSSEFLLRWSCRFACIMRPARPIASLRLVFAHRPPSMVPCDSNLLDSRPNEVGLVRKSMGSSCNIAPGHIMPPRRAGTSGDHSRPARNLRFPKFSSTCSTRIEPLGPGQSFSQRLFTDASSPARPAIDRRTDHGADAWPEATIRVARRPIFQTAGGQKGPAAPF